MSVVERVRPLLGTFVSVRVQPGALSTAQIDAAVDSAFRAMAQVDRLMSFHRRSSDVGRINRGRPGAVVRVHRWTHAVLALAQHLGHASGGTFDCNVGVPLVRAGLLPHLKPGRVTVGRPRTDAAMNLSRDRRIILRRRVMIDLGGIAKGFAVDRAVAVLRSLGVPSGAVNAGGDLRVFGDSLQPVAVRLPNDPGNVVQIGALANGAVATSASYFVAIRPSAPAHSSAIVNTTNGRRACLTGSVSVIAKTCMLADALTKIAVLKGSLPTGLARRAQASIVRL